jgi:lysophospholipase L1-like esterase
MSNMGNRRGEGREGWEYANFVGLSSIWGNDYSIIVPDASSTTTNLNLNPFLKVATDEDKANYPDWCFTYNKVVRETSYSDAEDKSQTFYIFDIANYLSAHSVDTPDIITIALSTNDINRRDDYLETCLFSMDVMISRIREQLPNVKIGIIPSPAWGYGNNTFTTKTAGWIEECMTAVNAKNDNNVFIVPIWCHMNRTWGFPTTDTDLSTINNSKSATISDTIHPGTAGQEQYGKAMAMFIANMCL